MVNLVLPLVLTKHLSESDWFSPRRKENMLKEWLKMLFIAL